MILSYSYSNLPINLASLIFGRGYSFSDDTIIRNPYDEDEGEELTRLCMETSEGSLSEVWDDEDDEYWASFLNE